MNGHVRDQLSAYLDDALPALERRTVEAHLEACPECTTYLAELAAVDRAVRDFREEPPAGYFDALPGRVRARLKPRPAFLVSTRSWAAIAALVLFAVTPILLLRQRSFSQAPLPPAPVAPAPSEAAGNSRYAASPTPKAALGTPQFQAPEVLDKAAEQAGKPLQDAEAEKRSASRAAPPPPKPRPQELKQKEADGLKALGYVQGQLEQAPAAALTPAAAPTAPASRRENAPADAAARDAAAPQGFAAEPRKDVPSPPGSATAAGAAVPAPAQALAKKATSDRLLSLRGRAASSAVEAREIRERFRMLLSQSTDSNADEARFGLVEAGNRAFQLSQDPADREVLVRDAKAYLAHEGGAHRDEVQRMLGPREP